MSKKRLTLEEMEQKYPNEWLFTVDCEHSENTELISGRVLVHSKSRADIYDASGHYTSGVIRVNSQKGWTTCCNRTYSV